jgi:Pentapeptide repeats (8 copies)
MPERPQTQVVRVFLSSPGDVADERASARRLLKEELPYDRLLQGRVTFEVVSWDDPAGKSPMPANLTPQAAVNRFGPKPSECDVVVVVLWSRLGTHLDVKAFRKSDGEPYLSGTEWEFEDALHAQPQPEVFVYRRLEEPKVGMKDPNWSEKRRQYELVEQFFERFKNPDGSLRSSWKSYDTTTEFQKSLADDLKSILRERLDRPYVGAVAEAVPVWPGSPYPGLRPFTTEEAPIFFGRGPEVDALIARLREQTQCFLAVVGASGSGKSSLVRAGLLPRLRDGAIDGSQHWRVLTLTPGATGDNPFLAVASELKGLLPAGGQKSQIEIARALEEKPQCLLDYVNVLLAGRPTGAALVLYVDQLEELFTQVPKERRGVFAELLARATNNSRVRVLTTLRADFLSESTAERALAALLRASTFVLGPPGPAALSDLVRNPAERAGLDLEDGLADDILRDAGGDPGALPLIAFCLEELYQRTAPEHRLTLEGYKAMGGLRGAIGQRAGKLLAEFRETQGAGLDKALSRVFDSLVCVDAGKAARQRASRDELMVAPAPIPQLVEKLIYPGRLLVAENTGGQATVTLAHDALLQEWPDLRDWLGGDYLALLQKGVDFWNAWRAKEPFVTPNLNRANLSGEDLQGADLHEAKLDGANLSGADLQGADLHEARLDGANLAGADLQGADLHEAKLDGANLSGADLQGADLQEAKLSGANLKMANLRNARLSRADLKGADLREANLIGGAKQMNLIITESGEPEIIVDDIEVVNFTDLILHNQKIRNVIDAAARKAVLILGRFTSERKEVLDAVRDELRKRNYLPILFDFEVPATRGVEETLSLLARMACFIIADISDAKNVLQELRAIVPDLPSVPVQPIIVATQEEPASMDFFRRYPWVMKTYRYHNLEQLLANVDERVIRPAEEKVRDLFAQRSSEM